MLKYEKEGSFIYCKNGDGYALAMIYRQMSGTYVGCNYMSDMSDADRREIKAKLDELNANKSDEVVK